MGIIIAVALVMGLVFYNNTSAEYSVVQLANGQLYVGKLHSFPRLKMIDAYVLQVVRDEKDPEKNTFQLAPLSDTVWSPRELYLGYSQIDFYGPLEETSRIVQGIKQQKK